MKERALGRLLCHSHRSTLMLIRNAAALAAASSTLLFSDWKNAARLKRNESDWLRCDGKPVASKCASVSRWACRAITKLFALGEDSGEHVLRETTSRGLCGLVCSSRTSERGGEGDCVKEGGGGQGKRERERARKTLARRHTDGPLWAALLKTTVICEA